jgi:hypothetical protein
MKTVWKFPLKVIDFQIIKMPVGYQFLCVQTQSETPCLWALVDDRADKISVEIITHGTGHPCMDIGPKQYIGSYQLEGGALIFHVWGEVSK